MYKSKTMAAIAKRNKRYDEVKVVMDQFAEAMKKNNDYGYAYMAGYLQSLVVSIAADSVESTEDVINQLKNSSIMKGV
jgi:DNA-binding ferritin-like protein